MIVSRPQPPPKPVAPPERKEAPARVGMTHDELCDLASELRPVVTIPARLNEWVFQVRRNQAGQIESINAKGHAK